MTSSESVSESVKVEVASAKSDAASVKVVVTSLTRSSAVVVTSLTRSSAVVVTSFTRSSAFVAVSIRSVAAFVSSARYLELVYALISRREVAASYEVSFILFII